MSKKKLKNPKSDPEPAKEPGQCQWLVVTVRCRIPLGEGECMPTGCDANCPARLQQIIDAQQKEKECLRFYT